MTYSFKQGDPKWGTKKISNSNKTMAGFGCLVTALVDALNDHEITKDTPGDACDKLNAIKGFDEGQLMYWQKARDLYPDIKDNIISNKTSLDPRPADTKTPIIDAIKEIKKAIKENKIVILHVDASKNNGVNEGDHFVNLAYIDAPGSMFISDPIRGTVQNITDNYGTPEKVIYGYRIITLEKIMIPLNVKENTVVMEAPGAGSAGRVGIVFSVNGVPTMHFGSLMHIWNAFFTRNAKDGMFREGPVITVTPQDFVKWPQRLLP